MEHYYNGHAGGMHFIWWIIWIIVLFWIFFTPYNIPGQRKKKGSAMDILKQRFVKGEISKEEYEEKKGIIQNNL